MSNGSEENFLNMDSFDFSSIAIFGVIAAFWRQFQEILHRIRGVVIQKTCIIGGAADAVSNYLLADAKVFQWGDGLILSQKSWVRPLNRVTEVAWEGVPVYPILIVWRNCPLFLQRVSRSSEKASNPDGQGDKRIYLSWVRGTIDIKQLTGDALNWKRERETTGSRFRIVLKGINGRVEKIRERYGENITTTGCDGHNEQISPHARLLHWTHQEIGPPKDKGPFDAYVLCDASREMREDFLKWLSLREWYRDRGIPWRRGHLLYGPPGTGKTALVRAIAQEADIPIFSFSLDGMGGDEFKWHWSEIQAESPCVALIEDIDGVFHGRKNVALKDGAINGLTFDRFLNAIGGVDTSDGIFLVITTNHPEHLDEALGRPTENGSTTRPGRLDRSFCLPLPDETQRSEMLRRILRRDPTPYLESTKGMAAAGVTEFAVKIALKDLWEGKESHHAHERLTPPVTENRTNLLA